MKVGIYSPYLDTAGGGEKYILTIAEFLSQKEQVDVFLDQHLLEIGIDKIKHKIESLHGLDLTHVNFIKAPFGKGSSAVKRFIFLQDYEWLFYLTDGSIFLSSAKNSIIHFQVPFENTAALNSWGKYKLSSWDLAIYNSNFTKDIVEKTWKVKGIVIYPPVFTYEFKSMLKKKRILNVGRFYGYLKDKKQGVLIDAFKKLIDEKKLEGWSLHLAGGAGEGDEDYLDQLRKQAKGYEIHFYPNASLEELKTLYGYASIYWHAAGFGEEDPKKFEHFGITAVEAMSAGAVPVVVNKGGLVEIVDQTSGYKWDSLKELENYTIKLVEDKNLWERFSKNGIKRSQMFSKTHFWHQIDKLVYGHDH